MRRLRGGLDELGLRRPRLAASCSLRGRTGDRRRLELCRVELAPVLEAARARGATVNDLVVTAVTGGLVALLERRGESGGAGAHDHDVEIMRHRVPVVGGSGGPARKRMASIALPNS